MKALCLRRSARTRTCEESRRGMMSYTKTNPEGEIFELGYNSMTACGLHKSVLRDWAEFRAIFIFLLVRVTNIQIKRRHTEGKNRETQGTALGIGGKREKNYGPP